MLGVLPYDESQIAAALLLFGVLTLIAGVAIIVNPDIVFGVLRRNSEELGLQVLAIGARRVVGALLIHSAGISRFPRTMDVIGWLAIVAVITFAGIGRNNFKRFIAWALSLQKTYGRVAGLIAICFGGFLVYAIV